jgi:hypothetical protein
MLNPFITNLPRDTRKALSAADREQMVHYRDYSIANSTSPSRNWIWRLGSLLIRMGARLTKENSTMGSINRNA